MNYERSMGVLGVNIIFKIKDFWDVTLHCGLSSYVRFEYLAPLL